MQTIKQMQTVAIKYLRTRYIRSLVKDLLSPVFKSKAELFLAFNT